MNTATAAFQTRTSDGVIGTSGSPVIVYGFHTISGGSAGIVILRSGTTVSSTAILQDNGTINTGKTVDLGANGVLFPNGLYLDVDANVTSCTVFYVQL